MKKLLMAVFMGMFVNAFSQNFIINGDLAFNARSGTGNSPFFGGSGVFLKEINNGFCVGGLLGLRFSSRSTSVSKITTIHIPIMGEARYYVNGKTEGFYPVANLGILSMRTTTTVTIMNSSSQTTVSTTGFAFAVGAGYHVNNVDFSIRYENVSIKVGSAQFFNFKLGFMLGESRGRRR